MSNEELILKKYKYLRAGLLGIKPILDKPYPDDPRWTPWTRFVEPRLIMLEEAFKGNDMGQLAALAFSKKEPPVRNVTGNTEITGEV